MKLRFMLSISLLALFAFAARAQQAAAAVRLALSDLQAALAAPGATPLKRVTVGQPTDAGVTQAAARRLTGLDTLGGEEDVNAAARAQVEDRFSHVQLRKRRRIPAPQ